MRAIIMIALLAVAGTANAAAAEEEVTHFPAREVASAFGVGKPLVETGGYKVHASRRVAPGMGEVHDLDTDIIYVLEGAATLVTGGTLVGGKEIAPHERRGAAIEGGDARKLVKGDCVIVPRGTPHWFREVDGPLLYYVVKVSEMEGGAR